jgi:molybdopterin-containing oxidoreductase family iron-sulfur binding subunit
MKQYWRSIEEQKKLTGAHPVEYTPGAMPEFSVEGLSEEEKSGKHSRRDFLKLLGFSVSYAAVANSCEMPVRKAIPYLNKPEEIVPGVANYYASTFFDGHDYCSILVKSREGRPIKIEGNELSKLTRGGTTARVQASVLSLYDLARLKGPMKDKSLTSWGTMDQEIPARLKEISGRGGKIALVTTTVISPSTIKVIEDFRTAYPTTEWITYDVVSAAGMLDANEANFGTRVIPCYHFDKASLIVGFNADFLGNWLLPVKFARDYTKGRKLMQEDTMSRHIQFESWMSLTGSNADKRIPIKPSEELAVLLNLLNQIAVASGGVGVNVPAVSVDVASVATELLENKGRSIVVSGTNDFFIQATVNAINYLLGNYGATIDLNKPMLLKKGKDSDMARLADELNSGQVKGLILYNVNPVYDYPEAEKFFSGMKNAELTVCFNAAHDESARMCQYVCPDSHYLESWNDAEPVKGQYSLAQPVINPIFDTRQAQENLLRWSGNETGFDDYIRKYWEENLFPKQTGYVSFTSMWNQSLHDGVFSLPSDESAQPAFTAANPGDAGVSHEGTIELVLYEKIGIGTGSMANNPWLQELPDAISKAVWDNYVCVSPSYAEAHGLEQEDVVKVNGLFELPVLIQPGQHKETVGIAIGYGRTSAGRVADGIGQNAFPLMNIKNGYRQLAGKPVTIEKLSGKTYPLATTQTHHTMEGRAIVRETTLEEWKEDPKSGNEMHKKIAEQNLTLYSIPTYKGFNWSMAINLNACIGCGNCAIACQAENNVAVIGKQEVKNRRIMHWIRIDRYYSEGSDNPEVTHMPVMCQHCDNAPCENVCPVAATPHSDEGLNQMSYNRCIGTRYCMNNCPYRVRRFNWFEYTNKERFDYNMGNEQEKLVLNPDVTVRSRGVVEKCSMCVQRIQEKKLAAKTENRQLLDGEIRTACQQSCPGDAIVFGDINDPNSEVARIFENPRTYQLLEQLHTLPSVSYVTKVRNLDPAEKKRNYSSQYPVYGSADEKQADPAEHSH